MKSVGKWFGAALMVLGLTLFLVPDFQAVWNTYENQQTIADFQEAHSCTVFQNTATAEENAPEPDPLRTVAEQYNQRIFAEHQSGISDAWMFPDSSSEWHLEDDLFGFIEIPAMEVSLPLYLGASSEHMARGAVVLGQTSLPIGGVNTNSVIAGHRGYQGIPFFREIEALKVGDTVMVTNPWEKLTYSVTEINVIEPYNLDAVLIQPGRDMVTLVTCHPYRSHGRYRYVVYCDRVQDEQPTSKEAVISTVNNAIPLVSSKGAIAEERWLRIIGMAVILCLLILAVLPGQSKK